jgi:hemerythrin-like domain-containing protein
MIYDDEETRKLSIKKAEILKEVQTKLTPENIEKIKESVSKMAQALKDLKDKPHRTPEDEELFSLMLEEMPKIHETLGIYETLLMEGGYLHSLAFFEEVKKMAEEGDEEAMKIYLDLKPSHEAGMREGTSEN